MLEGAKSIGAGAATIALAGAAVGIGNVLSSSIHSVALKTIFRILCLISIRIVVALPIFLVMWFGSQGSLPIDPHILGVGFVRQGLRTICRLLGFDMPFFIIMLVASILMGTGLGMVNPAGGAPAPDNEGEGAASGSGAEGPSNSALYTYTSDLVDDSSTSGRSGSTASSVNQPLQGEQAAPPAEEEAPQLLPAAPEPFLPEDLWERLERRVSLLGGQAGVVVDDFLINEALRYVVSDLEIDLDDRWELADLHNELCKKPGTVDPIIRNFYEERGNG